MTTYKTKISGKGLATFLGASALMASQAGATLIGHWAFDEGTGSVAADSSGLGNNGVIANATWGSDSTRSSYIVLNGTNSVVDPNVTLPQMSGSNDFTWAFWANSNEAIGATQQNAIIIGNRRDGNNVDYSPRQFIKFTPTKFEWHQNGNGNDNQEYDDLVVGEWHHHAVVKTGTSVQYYRDGVAVGGPGTLNESLADSDPMRFFIGGETNQTSVNEFFNGAVDDVRIYDIALSASEISALVVPEPSSLLLGILGFGMALRRRR